MNSAINSVIQHTLIKASAGSGKTFQLSNRFITLLALDESPDKILATTFTRKAAGEILSRVFTRLAQGASSAAAAAKLSAELNASLTQARCGELLSALVRSQHRLNICTMDSFCVKVARAFALELGFSTSWDILDEQQDRELREEALQELLYGIDPEEVSTLTRLVGNNNAGRSVYVALLARLGSLYNLFLDSPLKAWGAFQVSPDIESTQLQAILAALPEHALPMTKKGAPDLTWVKARARAVALVQGSRWEEFLDSGIAAKVISDATEFSRHPIPDEVAAVYKQLIEHAKVLLLTRANKASVALATLLAHFDQAYSALKIGRAALRFSDIKRALSKAPALHDLSSLYYRLDSRIHHLLLDEFQDTSSEEWQVMLPLAEEILAQGVDRRSFFCVGDIKQAIYGWRGGVAEIFDAVEKRFADVLEPARLDVSRRSTVEIIDTVNTVFGAIASNAALADYPAAATAWAGRFSTHAAHDTTRHGYVELRCTGLGTEADPDGGLYHELGVLVSSLISQAPTAQIGILVRRNKIAARVRYELQRPEFGVLAREEGGSPVTDSPAVGYVLSALTMSDHPGDTVARFHLATSPLGAELEFTDFADGGRAENVARYVRSRLLQDGYGAAVRWLTNLLLPYCSERDQSRLQQLCELALLFEPRATLRADDFVRFVEAARRESGGAAQVRVMTVHQSKGLEFDVVILPELDRPLVGEVRSKPVLFDRPSPLEPLRSIICTPPGPVVEYDPALQRMKQQMDNAVVSESLSVLYVALTRAKTALYALTHADQSKNPKIKATFAGVLQAACAAGASLDPGVVLYQLGESRWQAAFQKDQTSKVVPPMPLAEVRLKVLSGPRTRLLPRRSPSGMEGGGEGQVVKDLAAVLNPGSAQARSRGTLLHRFFEQVTWIDDGVPQAAQLEQLAQKECADPALITRVKTDFSEALALPAVAALLQRKRYSAWSELEVWRERSFALREGEYLLSGAFDRVVIGRNGQKVVGAEIVDFKSDHSAGPAKVDFYRPQIESYRRALALLLEIEPAMIKAVLVFVRLGEVISL